MLGATPLASLGLSDRTLYSLQRAGINHVGEALAMPESELLEIRNFGRESLGDLYSKLFQKGSFSENTSTDEDDSGDELK